MPNYDFQCLECGHKFTKLVPLQEKDKVRCPECGGHVKQLFGSFGFAVKGSSGSCSSSSSCGFGGFS
ncbi:MAG: FmdB family zinc ribbon protein [Bacillota bacterium]